MHFIAGVSVSTVKRRKTDFGLLSPSERSKIADSKLDEMVKKILSQQGQCGIVMIQAEFRANGYWISRRRVRESLIRIIMFKELIIEKRQLCLNSIHENSLTKRRIYEVTWADYIRDFMYIQDTNYTNYVNITSLPY